MTKNIFIAVLAGLLVLFVVLYLRKPKEIPKTILKYKSVDSALQVENSILLTKYGSLLKSYEALKMSKAQKQIVIQEIPAKYEKLSTHIYRLPADSQLRIFAEWIAQVDTAGLGYGR